MGEERENLHHLPPPHVSHPLLSDVCSFSANDRSPLPPLMEWKLPHGVKEGGGKDIRGRREEERKKWTLVQKSPEVLSASSTELESPKDGSRVRLLMATCSSCSNTLPISVFSIPFLNFPCVPLGHIVNKSPSVVTALGLNKHFPPPPNLPPPRRRRKAQLITGESVGRAWAEEVSKKKSAFKVFFYPLPLPVSQRKNSEHMRARFLSPRGQDRDS